MTHKETVEMTQQRHLFSRSVLHVPISPFYVTKHTHPRGHLLDTTLSDLGHQDGSSKSPLPSCLLPARREKLFFLKGKTGKPRTQWLTRHHGQTFCLLHLLSMPGLLQAAGMCHWLPVSPYPYHDGSLPQTLHPSTFPHEING